MRLELNKIHLGDCIEVMKALPSESIGTIVTSPPYNLKNISGNGLKNKWDKGKWKNVALADGYDGHGDNMPHNEYVGWQRECLSEMMRLLKPNGAIFYNHKWRVQKGLIQDRSDIVSDFPVRQIIIWERDGGLNFNKYFFLPNYEVIYFITKPECVLVPGANKIGCVWKISQERNNPHPAPFPVELPKRCIESLMNGPVLDPFIGSGTTAIAAMELGLDWIGIEKSEQYKKAAEERINLNKNKGE